MERIEGSETSAIINQTPGNYPKGNLLYNFSNLPHQTVEKLQKKTMGSSEDPSLVNNVDELGLVYWG